MEQHDTLPTLTAAILGRRSPFTVETDYRALDERIERFDRVSMPGEAKYLRVLLGIEFRRMALPDALRQLGELAADRAIADSMRVRALTFRAQLGFNFESPSDNVAWRVNAMQIAMAIGAHDWCIGILVNWIAAEVSWEHWDAVNGLLGDLDRLLADSSTDVVAACREPISRSLTFRGKLALNLVDDITEAAQSAADYYREAIEREIDDDERRFNYLVDFSWELIKFHQSRGVVSALSAARAVLERAVRSLEAHSCWRCRGFYGYVLAIERLAEARTAASTPIRASELLVEALAAAETAVQELQPMNHPLGNIADELAGNIRAEMEERSAPRRIFLSHAGADKPLIRQLEPAPVSRTAVV